MRFWWCVAAGIAAFAPAPTRADAQTPVELVIAATTDVHGRLRGWDYTADRPDSAHSLAAAATIVDSIRRVHPASTVLVDAGDLLQGNPLTFAAARVAPTPVHPVIASMNVMRYDAAVIGNHEFNYGVPFLRAAIARSAFPFLGANVLSSQGPKLVAPYTIVERAGIRIGIVGATTPGSMIWDQANLRAAGVTIGAIVPAVRAAVRDAQRARCDVVVVLLHSGLDEASSYDTVATALPSENVAARVAREVSGIDLVVYGHSHRELIDSTIGSTLMIQPRNWAGSVAVATLFVERVRGKWRVTSRHGQSVSVRHHAESRDVLAASSRSHAAAIAWSALPIGTTSHSWSADSARVVDMPITDFVAEVMRRHAKADLAATSVFSLEGSFPAGDITRAQIARLYPYENTVRAVRIDGATLRRYLEETSRYYQSLDANGRAPASGMVNRAIPGYNFDMISGVDYVMDLSKAPGERIATLTFRGRPVTVTDTFTLALNNYRQSGGGGYSMLAALPVVFSDDADIRQLLIDEVSRVKTLDPLDYATRNWRIEPAAARAAAYAEQRAMMGAEHGGGAAAAHR